MKLFIFLIPVFMSLDLSAQNPDYDILYLKNGSVIKGKIIKNLTDSTTAVKTRDGSVFVYNNKEVERTEINNGAPSARKNNLWVGLNFEPQFQNIFKSHKEYLNFTQQYPGGNILLPGTGGVQLGIKLYYLPLGYAGFETGVQYHFYQSQETFLRIINAGTESEYSNNRFHNLEIPVFINVHSAGKKVRFYSADGISAGITLRAVHSQSLSATGYTTKDTSFITHADSSAFFYCVMLVSAGVQLSLAENTLLNLTAAFRLNANGPLGATNPFFVPNPYVFIPYSIGLNIEILFHTPDRIKNRNDNFSLLSEMTNTDVKEQENRNKARAKHESWNYCFMVLLNGDTIKGKVQKSEDYSLTGGLFSRGKVLFAHTDESEEKIRASQFKELYIPAENPGYRKYITIESDEFEDRKIYRVVTDGKCQSLSDNITGSVEPLGAMEREERFYICYKDKLMQISPKAAYNKSPEFREKCKEFFSDCPELKQKIENKSNQLDDIGIIVKEFNNCIGSH